MPEDTDRDHTQPAAPRSRLPVTRQLAILALLLVGIFSAGGASWWIGGGREGGAETAAVGGGVASTPAASPSDEADFSDLKIQARSAIVIDLQDGTVLYEKDADESWPLASITKLMTALVASEIVKDGAVIPITDAAVSQAEDGGVAAGERFSYKNLSDLTLLRSSNDGAYALSAALGRALDEDAPDVAFVKAMNVRAKELGLTSTYFRNPTGLDISETEAGAYGTARDVARLLGYIVENRPELLEATTVAKDVFYDESGAAHQASNTNQAAEAIPALIASKTGYTTLAGGNLAVAFDVGVNHPVVAVVLGSTHQGRFSDTLGLVRAARRELTSQ